MLSSIDEIATNPFNFFNTVNYQKKWKAINY